MSYKTKYLQFQDKEKNKLNIALKSSNKINALMKDEV